VAEAYEVGRPELIRDARTAWTWSGPTDDLVMWLSEHHGWPANMAVDYLDALAHARDWNKPTLDW
jgi:hypothetical protein